MNRSIEAMAEEDEGAIEVMGSSLASTKTKADGTLTQEEQLLRACAHRVDQLAQLHPDWFVYFDDVQALSASRNDIAELLRCAPNEFARGLMYGIYLMRSEISIITGREFK